MAALNKVKHALGATALEAARVVGFSRVAVLCVDGAVEQASVRFLLGGVRKGSAEGGPDVAPRDGGLRVETDAPVGLAVGPDVARGAAAN